VKLAAYPCRPGTGPGPAVYSGHAPPARAGGGGRPGHRLRPLVELWPEIAGKGHPDDQRATVLTGPDGHYRFQSDPPEHIHMLVSATGFEPVASNRYHPEGRAAGRFDVVLAASRP
jgi:hypothetical protein